MEKRERVYVQVQNKVTKRWKNSKAADTYEEAVALMEQKRIENPLAIYRVLKPNLYDHQK